MKSADDHLQPDISKLIVEMQQQPSHWLSRCGHWKTIGILVIQKCHEIPYSLFVSAFVCRFWYKKWPRRKRWAWVWLYTRVQNLQCVEAEKEANLIVGTIRRRIVNKVNETILRLYKCSLRRLLEYYIQIIIAINRTWTNWRKCEQERARCF